MKESLKVPSFTFEASDPLASHILSFASTYYQANQADPKMIASLDKATEAFRKYQHDLTKPPKTVKEPKGDVKVTVSVADTPKTGASGTEKGAKPSKVKSPASTATPPVEAHVEANPTDTAVEPVDGPAVDATASQEHAESKSWEYEQPDNGVSDLPNLPEIPEIERVPVEE